MYSSHTEHKRTHTHSIDGGRQASAWQRWIGSIQNWVASSLRRLNESLEIALQEEQRADRHNRVIKKAVGITENFLTHNQEIYVMNADKGNVIVMIRK